MTRKQLRKCFIKPTQTQIDEFNQIPHYNVTSYTWVLRRNFRQSVTHTRFSTEVYEWFMKHFGNKIGINENETFVFSLPLAIILLKCMYIYDQKKASIIDKNMKEKNYAVYVYEEIQS